MSDDFEKSMISKLKVVSKPTLKIIILLTLKCDCYRRNAVVSSLANWKECSKTSRSQIPLWINSKSTYKQTQWVKFIHTHMYIIIHMHAFLMSATLIIYTNSLYVSQLHVPSLSTPSTHIHVQTFLLTCGMLDESWWSWFECSSSDNGLLAYPVHHGSLCGSRCGPKSFWCLQEILPRPTQWATAHATNSYGKPVIFSLIGNASLRLFVFLTGVSRAQCCVLSFVKGTDIKITLPDK